MTLRREDWHGVLPALTTPFDDRDRVDHRALAALVRRVLDGGCRGTVTPGSLGEGATLSPDEKVELWKTCVNASEGRGPVIASIAAASTREAVAQAEAARAAGCTGLMVLPPYVYRGDWSELRGHVGEVLAATPLSCMLYNNPPAYGSDFTPTHVAELAAAHGNLHAVKESSGDVRRITGIRALCGDRVAVLVGLDDCVVEGVRMGACGWIAGLANALPRESVELFEAARTGDAARADRIYRWFLPLLRLDTHPKFVQYIKLVQAETCGDGERVRAPRRELAGEERAAILSLVRATLKSKPA
jgi:dihydrodipicolinate synthase/N-acetylneuraminate lyase